MKRGARNLSGIAGRILQSTLPFNGSPTPAAPQSLVSAVVRSRMTDYLTDRIPAGAMTLLMSSDHGKLAHDLAPACRMLFSADADGNAAGTRYAPSAIDADCDPTHLWLAENSLDAAVLVNVLQRYEDPTPVLQELQRVLKDDGLLVLAMTTRPDSLSAGAWRGMMAMLGVPDVHAWQTQPLQAMLEAHWIVETADIPGEGLPMTIFVCTPADGRRA